MDSFVGRKKTQQIDGTNGLHNGHDSVNGRAAEQLNNNQWKYFNVISSKEFIYSLLCIESAVLNKG